MNCVNCGAPLRLVEGRDHFRCDYCTTLHFPAPLEATADGVKLLGEESDFHCPVCGVALAAGSLDGHRVLLCPNCRGVLIEGDRFMDVVLRRRAQRTGPPVTPSPLNQEELRRKVDCPVCAKPMEVHPYHGPGNVVIDSCTRCHLVWLDHGEIAAVERAPGAR